MNAPSGRRLAGVALFAAALLAPHLGLPLLGAVAAGRIGWALARWIGRRYAGPTDRSSIVLGSDQAGRRVTLSDRELEAHALIVGASGAGKTTTVQTILTQQVARGRATVAIDMKGSRAFERDLELAAGAAGRRLVVWRPEGETHWNPLAHGGPTALKDKLISAERFSEPHYQRAAERHLQLALTVLLTVEPQRRPSLSEVVDALVPARLARLARRAPEPLATRVREYVASITPDQVSAAAGLGTRLALLSESVAGPWLEPGGRPDERHPEIDLAAALDGGDVVLFSLNSSTYGGLAAQLGVLAIQDLTSAAGRRLDRSGVGRAVTPATVVVEEFSALGADNVLSLLARGREAGVSVLLTTQELADLERAARGFRDQVLGIIGCKLAHRQALHSSAQAISSLAGTRRVWRETQQLQGFGARAPASRGTRREVEEPVVHPNEIKRLRQGQLVLLSELPEPRIARTRVRRVSPARDQTAPGVTR